MKKRINLFKITPIGTIPLLRFFTGRVMLIYNIVGIIFFIFFLYFVYKNIRLNSEIAVAIDDRKQYLEYLLNNKEIEAKLQYFKTKQNQLDIYSKDDAHFLPYYNVLVEALKYATNSPSLETVLIDKKRETSFIVKLNDFDSAMGFLKYVESPIFLESFKILNLVDFNLLESIDKKAEKNYQFTFEGAFNEIRSSL